MNLPEFISPLKEKEEFQFNCHSGVPCFTDCCRELELSLTPYDVLRLRKATGLHSAKLLEKYVIMEHPEDSTFPRYYLTMVDDGRASCIFVNKRGCSVYEHRPGACRTYPMGRAAIKRTDGTLFYQYVLLKENHCRGFAEKQLWTPITYTSNQHLEKYNKYNDQVADILQHEEIRKGKRLTSVEISAFNLAMYDLDTFKEELTNGHLSGWETMTKEQIEDILTDDEKLFEFAISWLKKELFTS